MLPTGLSGTPDHGVHGRYLDVNLSSGCISDYEIPTEWYVQHLGGKGVAARILLNELAGEEEPLSPENILIFATGPFQGTGLVGAGRHVVMGISPKTKAVADSYAGGFFGHELGRSGFDGIVLRGAAAEPVVLSVIDGIPELLPATELWGKGTGKTTEVLAERYPRAHVAAIGIAGENLVQSACIIHDRNRAAGRPGFGAVMGAKRLKAIVIRGNTQKAVHDDTRFRTEKATYAKLFLDGSMDEFGEFGTSRLVVPFHEMGILPTQNFREGVFEPAEQIDGRTMAATILVDRESCAGCPIRCKRVVRTSFMGRAVIPEFGGPEYETVVAFGSLCLNHDLRSIALANQLCNDYGIDTISAGVACAFLMEASQKNLIAERISWGDAEAMLGLVEKIESAKAVYAERAAQVAQNTSEEVARGIIDKITKVRESGGNLKDFRNQFTQFTDDLGISRFTPHRIETIYRTNINSAYQAGFDQEIEDDPFANDLVVAFRYDAVNDSRVRPTHEKMEGVFARTDPFWNTHTPPNGYNCRCIKTPVTKFDVERGVKVEDSTGKNIPPPDQGFSGNPRVGIYDRQQLKPS